MLQGDVANKIGVSTDCVTNWENDRSSPQIRYMPDIIQFLGYNPVMIESVSLGEMIKDYRIRNGLSCKKLGNKLGVDASTVGAWEKGECVPKRKNLKLLNLMLESQ